MFLGLWLSSFALTWGALSYQAYYGGYYTASLFQLIVLEVGVLVSWACYWMILYPRYFTPFRNLPTPQVCEFVILDRVKLTSS